LSTTDKIYHFDTARY